MATQAILIINADEYADAVLRWRSDRCTVAPGWSTSASLMYRDYARWCERNDDWPCDSEQFITLLRQSGTQLFSVGELVFASGVGLAEDVETV